MDKDPQEIDFINCPPHYTSHPTRVECIEIVEHFPYNIGAAIKYLWRSAMKGQVEDLQKAAWHIRREVMRQQTFGEMSEDQKRRLWEHVKDLVEDEHYRCSGPMEVKATPPAERRPAELSEHAAMINQKIEEFRKKQEAEKHGTSTDSTN
jgi:hypothetical protein